MRRAAFLFASTLLLLVSGCDTPQHTRTDQLPTFDAIAARQADRASKMKQLESSGTIELRTKSEDGEQFEDCALELWRDGEHFALRLRKLGERFLWVGSDGSQWWVFELAADPVRVTILPSGFTTSILIGDGEWLLGPNQLLELAGLEPIEPIAPLPGEEPLVLEDSGLIRFDVAGGSNEDWSRVRWYVDRKTFLPERIQALDDQGAVILEFRLNGYEPIPARDTPLGGWPDFPRKIRVVGQSGGTDVRFFFNRPSARGTRIKPALFDLERLMQTFRPAEVKYLEP